MKILIFLGVLMSLLFISCSEENTTYYDNIEFNQGVCYKKNSQIPFTGIVKEVNGETEYLDGIQIKKTSFLEELFNFGSWQSFILGITLLIFFGIKVKS